MANHPQKSKGRKNARASRQSILNTSLGIARTPEELPKSKQTAKQKAKVSGRPSQFDDEEIAWIRATYTDFDDMVLNRANETNIKSTIRDWKDRKWEEMKQLYAASLARPGNWKSVRALCRLSAVCQLEH